MLSCAAARAYALSLDLRASPGADGDVPNVHDVVGDHRFGCVSMLHPPPKKKKTKKKNTAYARLSGFDRPSCGASPAPAMLNMKVC